MDEAAQTSAFVKRKISQLSVNPNASAVRATLANLRRGIGKAPGSIPELWALTLEGLPEALMGNGSNPSRCEWAAHTALTLYALHQQGKDPVKQCMHQDGASLGVSVRRLIKDDEEERVKRRFDAAATADSIEEFSHHLRGLIQLLRAQEIPLDYAALTRDLYWFQLPEARDGIRLRWGRDFYRFEKNDNSDTEQA